jgi:hypothetical protein
MLVVGQKQDGNERGFRSQSRSQSLEGVQHAAARAVGPDRRAGEQA